MTAGYFVVCAVGNGALLISVGSVLQPLSLGFPAGEPMPVDFVRAVAKSVVEVAAPYKCVAIKLCRFCYFNFFSRRTPLYGPSVQVPAGTKPRFS